MAVVPAATLLPPESEAHFAEQFDSFARALGWDTYHTYDSRRSSAGFPDYVLVRGDRLLFVELKRVGGKATPTQQRWHEKLARVPCIEVYLWTPAHWEIIAKVLSR